MLKAFSTHSMLFMLSALMAVTLTVGCDGGDAPLKISLKKVTRDKIELSVKSDPGLLVYTHHNNKKMTDDKGRARLVLDVPTEGDVGYDLRDGRVSVTVAHDGTMQAIHNEIFGHSAAAWESIELGFEPSALRNAPKSPKGAWIHFLGQHNRYGTSYACMSMDSDFGNGPINTKGAPFLGPSGAKVSIGDDKFTIKKSGLGVWKPSSNAMFELFSLGRSTAKLPLKVRLKGKKDLVGEVTVRLEDGCRSTAAKTMRKAVEKKKALPGSKGDMQPFVLLARADGSIKDVKARYDIPSETPFGRAKYVAIEKDGEKGPTTSCSKAVYYDATHDQIITVSRTPIKTKVRLYELPGYKKVASKSFDPGDSGCDSTVRVADYDITNWLREILKEREPQPLKTKRRPQRRRR